LPLEADKINALLGTEIPEADMVKYLQLLELPVVDGMIQVPSWRPDLNLMADIAEEVGRSYGYNEIPTTAFKNATQGGYSPVMLAENKAGQLCRSLGYSEIITYSFVSPTIFDNIRLPKDSALRNAMRIQNPLGEDTSIMRTIALPSMLDILSRNYAYHNKSVRLYELAKIYLPTEGQLPAEPKMLMLGAYGGGVTFFSMKGQLEAVLSGLRLPKATFTAVKDNPSFHPGRCAAITAGGQPVGILGQVHPLVCAAYGLEGEAFYAQLDMRALRALQAPEKAFVPLPRFPAVSRDIALVCAADIPVAELEDTIAASGGQYLESVALFDVYTGAPIPEGCKSVAFSLIYRDKEKTLTDEEVNEVHSTVLDALKDKLNAVLREM
jgi:phenylalanyl-tRNA synthetase beta chain